MGLRDERQREFGKEWLKSKFGILNLCPRFGKIKTAIYALRELGDPTILIVYPIETIRKSWEDDFVKWGYDASKVVYSTTASLWKIAENPSLYDVIIVDEVHLLSPANRLELKKLIDFGNRAVLGLSGTISDKTSMELIADIGFPIIADYDIETGIREKVITDYEIVVVLTTLDDSDKWYQPSKKRKYFITERQRYDYLSTKMWEIKEKVNSRRQAILAGANLPPLKLMDELGLLPLHRMHILKKSVAKLNITKQLVDNTKKKKERALVFCGVTDIADRLGVPVYHSKNKDDQVKDDFCSGKGDILATVDMFEAGVTVKPINKAIINGHDSNPENLAQRVSRLTGYEYDNPDKVARVIIVCTNTVEKDWLDKALEFFDLSKVKYIKA